MDRGASGKGRILRGKIAMSQKSGNRIKSGWLNAWPAPRRDIRRITGFAMILTALFLATGVSARAGVTVNVSGPGGNLTQTLPDAGGSFALNLPLSRNMVNNISVNASDIHGNSAWQDIAVTQVSLDNVVISEFTSEPLSIERIEELVNDGIIDLADPENFNVSIFTIVLTINNEPIPVSVPIVTPINIQEQTGFETYRFPWGIDSGSGRSNKPPVEIVVFEQPIPSPPGEPPLPPVPGVLIIQGRIKSLKEFYSCRLLLMNASGIFTLSDVVATLEFPDGGLSNVLPADGVVTFGEILPGDGDVPGQVQKEFIIRGDEIGVRRVLVRFGGVLTGPGIPEDTPIPFNGSAQTDVEVKGPPSFLVEVFHPDYVVPEEPYELRVDITNTGEMPALYTSLELDVGGDGEIVQCEVAPGTQEINCNPIEGPSVRNFGHILPGKTVSETVLVNPKRMGRISSCMAISDQNISLQVYVGDIGCLAGHYPPIEGSPDGRPTVTVLPFANAQNVGLDSPVVAFFSAIMNKNTITTGPDGSFNVYTASGDRLPGVMRFTEVMDKTVAIWQHQLDAGKLYPNTEFTVTLDQRIKDTAGKVLYNPWTSIFSTTGEWFEDDDPPTLTLTVKPPTDPNYVLPGELVQVNAYAVDQGSGVVRVEARLKDLDDPDAGFTLIDQKSVLLGDKPPYIFTVDSVNLALGHTYEFRASAYDYMGNMQEATLALVIANSADPPTLVLPPNPTTPQLQGIAVSLTPVSYTGGVREIRFYLDGAASPFSTAYLRPYQTYLRTLNLPIGAHQVRAEAVDGLGQTGEAFYSFELAENKNMPVVNFGSAVSSAQYALGSTFVVNIGVEDPVGIASVNVYLGNNKSDPITTSTAPFVVDTNTLGLGTFNITVVATNLLGVSNDPEDPASKLAFSIVEAPPGPPPAAPVVTNTPQSQNGLATIEGTAAAGARVDVTNTRLGITLPVYADASGRFSVTVQADPDDVLSLIAYLFSQSPNPSAATTVTVGRVPVLERIEVSPATIAFTAFSQSQNLTVTGYYQGGATANLTAQATFSSSASAVAGVNAAGRVAPFSNGSATITATVLGKQAQAAVTVNVLTLTHITVAPDPVLLVALAQTQALAVTAHYSDGSSRAVTSGISYSMANTSIATVNSAGVITAVREGNTSVTVYVPGASPVAVPVYVNTGSDPAPTVEILSPATGSHVERGQNVSVIVQGEDTLGGVTRFLLTVSGAMPHTDQIQVAPPALSVIRTFTFTVPANIAIGGTIQISVRAEDSGGNTSEAASITLTVGDATPPAVTVTEPAPMSEYNYGDIVTLRVTATDNVGVSQIRYFTQGAFEVSGTWNFAPPLNTAEAVFNIQVPYGLATPDVRIRAFAKDAAGNEGAAAPLDIVITDADIIPPVTVATAVSNPGSTPRTTVTYRVDEGLDDLDHVELFFRRDGIGTFNRYTRADAGNPLGHYTPQNGAIGTIVFDSTRMGGDGYYEFYTVGVDHAGNREAPPLQLLTPKEEEEEEVYIVVPDKTVTINAGTVWMLINTDTAITPENTTYNNKNVRVIGATLTVSGRHAFQNIDLLQGAVLTHPETDAENEYALDIEAWSIHIDPDSAINVNARGYLGARQPGVGDSGRTLGNVDGSTPRSGGSYGGPGGAIEGTPNALYGNLVQPAELGSGGSRGYHGERGGDGGGRIQIQAINVASDGRISAVGDPGKGNGAGSGSGGGIYLVLSTLSGIGPVAADGGAYQTGGGGGRIAVHYVDISTMDTSLIHALGGQGSNRDGGNGTVFMKGVDESNGTLVVDGQGVASAFSTLPIPPGYVFDNIIIRNEARVTADTLLEVNDTLSVLTGSILTHTLSSEAGLSIRADHIYVDETSRIDVSAKGYRGGRSSGNANDYGITLGGFPGATQRSGGTYGGYGGVQDGAGSNPPYGSPNEPVYLGSGGSRGYYGETGGHGGGRVDLVARKSVRIDGALAAEGERGYGNGAGSGSGGSIRIETSLLKGIGTISANGGAHHNGGGGGRVAIVYDYVSFTGDDFSELRDITAFGGHGSYQWGSAGTVLLQRRGQSYGDLYIDDGVEDATSGVYTPLTPICFGRIVDLTGDTITTDGKVAFIAGSLVGLSINPNIVQTQTFTITANTTATITVDTTNKMPLTAIAAIGDTYTGVYRFDNVHFRRGGFLVLGDRLEVLDTLRIEEYGRITHYDASPGWESRLDIRAGTLEISATASINTDARGYLGGRHDGNNLDEGLTLGNVPGASKRSGASYGGLGARIEGTTNSIYGSLTDPAALGSGGSIGYYGEAGGDGGGWIAIQADTMTLEGSISANGGTGGGNHAGCGSGGTINLVVGTLSGSGLIRANGGAYQLGGGGGRIAIDYDTLNLDTSRIEALGGAGSQLSYTGGNGTVFLKGPGQTYGELVIDGYDWSTPSDSTPMPEGYTFDNIILRNQARVYATASVVTTDALRLLNGSILTHPAIFENGLVIQTQTLEVDSTSAIDVSGRGYPGGRSTNNALYEGLTLGNLPGATRRAAGSYGGLGNVVDSGALSNPPYGHPARPVSLGSGGSAGYYGEAGGHGGGRLKVTATTLQVDGALRADGTAGNGNQAGCGSGGSIQIQTQILRGVGTISANGGAHQTSGGGGRIAIDYTTPGAPGNDLNGLRNITAFGGFNESAGTVLLRKPGQTYGDLYIDAGSEEATATRYTPLTHIGFGIIQDLTANTIVTDGVVRMIPNGLAGIEINPNLEQDTTYTVLSNTENSITVAISGKPPLTNVAAIGDTYAGIYRFDNVYLQRGGFLVMGDRLLVNDTLSIDEFGVLTHFDASTNFESRLEVYPGTLYIAETGSINADCRGYLGGRTGANGADYGLTLFNQPGASKRSGASYGGYGGFKDGTPNPVYGDPLYPAALGSGGSCGYYGEAGGDGGGWVYIEAGNTIVDGLISANGDRGYGNIAGSGSGGTVRIVTSLFQGAGSIQANGGAYQNGGGGGRIAVDYITLGGPGNDFNGLLNITAFGGTGISYPASAGTVVLRQSGQTYGSLYVDAGFEESTATRYMPLPHIGFGTIQDLSADTLTTEGLVRMLPHGLAGLPLNPNLNQNTVYTILDNTENTITVDLSGKPALTSIAGPGDPYAGVHRYNNVYFRRGGVMLLGDPLFVTGELRLDENGRITHYGATTAFESHLEITAQVFNILPTGAIDVDRCGYLGGRSGGNGEDHGLTLDNQPGSTKRSAGSYGGFGGAIEGTANPLYGIALTPEALGSGGSCGYHGDAGGHGGGYVWIHANNLSINGWITANGGSGGGNNAGSGSGGSILIYTPNLNGTGEIRANGGAHQVGGGGGRVALHYRAATSNVAGLSVTATGGTVSYPGQDGTVELAPGSIAPPSF
jgi:large repetitive protein